MSTALRNTQLLGQVANHPLRATLAKCLDLAESFRGDMEYIALDKNLSAQGRATERDKRLRAAIRDLRDAKAPINELRAKADAIRATVKRPPFDKSDVVGFLQRQELRAALRAMNPGERALWVTGAHRNQDFVDALLEQPPITSGFTGAEQNIVDAARDERLRDLFAPQLDQIAELESTIAEADMVTSIARVDIKSASGLDQHFDAIVTPIETKAAALWLIQRNKADPVVVINPAKAGTSEFQRIATPEEVRDGKFYASEAEYLADRAAA